MQEINLYTPIQSSENRLLETCCLATSTNELLKAHQKAITSGTGCSIIPNSFSKEVLESSSQLLKGFDHSIRPSLEESKFRIQLVCSNGSEWQIKRDLREILEYLPIADTDHYHERYFKRDLIADAVFNEVLQYSKLFEPSGIQISFDFVMPTNEKYEGWHYDSGETFSQLNSIGQIIPIEVFTLAGEVGTEILLENNSENTSEPGSDLFLGSVINSVLGERVILTPDYREEIKCFEMQPPPTFHRGAPSSSSRLVVVMHPCPTKLFGNEIDIAQYQKFMFDNSVEILKKYDLISDMNSTSR